MQSACQVVPMKHYCVPSPAVLARYLHTTNRPHFPPFPHSLVLHSLVSRSPFPIPSFSISLFPSTFLRKSEKRKSPVRLDPGFFVPDSGFFVLDSWFRFVLDSWFRVPGSKTKKAPLREFLRGAESRRIALGLAIRGELRLRSPDSDFRRAGRLHGTALLLALPLAAICGGAAAAE
jgi:hypothetical protein